MRVIAGKYRGRSLKSPPSSRTRPTSDRLRETLFNILAPRVEGARFLDLCAGSGAVGIEALSRGAAHVTFVDRSRKMCALIELNLDLCKVAEDDAEVLQGDATEFLQRVVSHSPRIGRRVQEPWDLVFFDPPYASGYSQTLQQIGTHTSLLAGDGLVIVEHHHKTSLPGKAGALRRARQLKQGDSCLSFYERG